MKCASYVGLSLLAVVLVAQGADPTPFVLPWDDATPGVTDFSGFNRPIDAVSRVSVDPEGHLAARGERIRFLGMNFAGDSPFMPTNKADAVAARLAKFGINNVRFHHMDAPWAAGGGLLNYTTTSSRAVDPMQLDRLHFLVSRLKAHGIYANINLLVGREYRSGDGLGPEVTTLSWKDQHILGFFEPTALALHKEYATRLLTPRNRYTGLSLAEDPATAFVEIINENGVLQKWFDGGLDGLPERYARHLRARWNDWLQSQYADDQALIAAWQPVQEPLGPNLLSNGTFLAGLTAWNLERHSGAAATFQRTADFNGQPAAKITVTVTGSASWNVQLNQPGLTITDGQVYTLVFSAKADGLADLDASVMQAHDPWQTIGFARTLPLTTEWQTFTNRFLGAPLSGTEDSVSRLNFGGLGTRLGTVWLADARLQTGGALGELPPGTSLTLGNLPNVLYVGDGFVGTTEARKDWLRFLRDLEDRYYAEMVAHLRTECGYPGLLFGTITANSPASVQSRLDVIDSHAYWQHPQFPGEPWDSVNWIVPNRSMVTTVSDDNTIPHLARQRIDGKPFTVTEYQHPSPMHFGAEGPLLLAAHAALQDWDGIWLFDYGHGNDSVPMGMMRSFFDTAQHPTKMANLLLAANLFRRADLPPLTNEVVLALTPDREIDLLFEHGSAWNVFNSSQLGVPADWAFHTRLGVRVGPDADGPSEPPPQPPPPAEPLAVRWQATGPDQGYVTVNTDRTRAAVGYLPTTALQLGKIELLASPRLLPWASVGLTLTAGQSFTNGTILVIASGWVENTGMQWKDANHDSVGNQWGTAPTLIETIPFRLLLPAPADQVAAWALDERGQRQSPMTVESTGPNQVMIQPAPDAATLWYEITVTPPGASFEGWRQQHFTPPQLDDPLVSGPAADPAGDHVPNYMKYTLARDPWLPVNRENLATWWVDFSGEGHRLTVEFVRRKAMQDARVRPLFSPDLRQWRPSPIEGAPTTIEDLGKTERVTLNSHLPGTEPADRIYGGLIVESLPIP